MSGLPALVRFGPFPAVPGKRTSQVNGRVGSRTMPGSTGFSYRVSVQGCGAQEPVARGAVSAFSIASF
jgi:hypothetical protein